MCVAYRCKKKYGIFYGYYETRVFLTYNHSSIRSAAEHMHNRPGPKQEMINIAMWGHSVTNILKCSIQIYG